MFHVTANSKLLVVDAALSAATDLIDGRRADFDVACLSSKEAPLAQIAALVERMGPLSDLHILSHGEPGALHLAGAVVDAAGLADAADALRRIAACLTPDAEVLLYGCSVASGGIGRDFVADLQDALGKPVAASATPVGSAARGGAWSFRTPDGMPAIPAFTPAARDAFAGLLATVDLTTGNDTLSLALTDDDDTITASIANSLNAGDVIDGKGGTDTLNITAAQSVIFNATTLTNVETVKIGHTSGEVLITTHNTTVAAGQTLTVDGSAATGAIYWFGASETDGKFNLTGGSGNDTLRGGSGADTLTGGAGDDQFIGTAASLAGDTITDFAAGDSITVADTDLSALNGQAASGTFDLGGGNTLTLTGLSAASGTFKVVYDDKEGESIITLVPAPVSVTASLTTGNDTPVLGDLDDTINAGIADSLNPDDVIDGKGGTDTLNITAAQNVTFNATTLTNVETVKIAHTDGTVAIITNNATVAAGQTLTVDGSAATGVIYWDGNAEADGNFSITGGSANDSLRGGAGNDMLTGGAGNDTLAGGAGSDTLIGGAGDDTLAGNNGADTLTGGAGNDYFAGSAFQLNGDTITDFAVGDSIGVLDTKLSALNGTAASGTIDMGGYSLNLTGITAVSGVFRVVVSGNESTITLVAPITVDLGAGDDTPVLDDANDTINASIANSLNAGDVINGEGGSDTLNITAEQNVVFNATTLTNVETVKISHTTGTVAITTQDATVAAGQTLTVDGSAATGTITWNGAAETDGTFSVTGGEGDDSLTGGAGSDTLIGGAGNDTLAGGAGTDTMTGGTGNDVFIGSISDLIDDIITDFAVGDSVVIQNINLSSLDNQTASSTIDMGGGQELTFTGLSADSGTFKAVFDGTNTTLTLVAPVPVTASLTTGNDTPVLAATNDTITASIANSLNPGDVIDGKGGSDTLTITAAQGVSFNATTLTNVEIVKISHTTGTVNIATNDATVAAGQTLTVDGSAATGTINWNAAQETDGKFSITGGLGNDTLLGGAGADTLTGGAGDDQFIGSAGQLAGDTITDFAVGDQIVVQSVDLTALNGQAASGTIDLGGGQTLTLTGISAASGAFEVTKDFSESYITLVAPVTFDLTAGNDTPVLSNGNDTVHAKIANSLNVGDVIDGKGGTDTLEITAEQNVVFNTKTLIDVEIVKIGHTTGTVSITTHDATVAAGQTLTVDGSAATGAIFWTGSDETDGKFSVTGGSGNDLLRGGAGSDTLIGGAGDDTLRGGDGLDTLTGGTGNDVFMGSISDLRDDRITDFSVGDSVVFLNADMSGQDGIDAASSINIDVAGLLHFTGLTADSGTFKAVFDGTSTTLTLVAPPPVSRDLTTGNDTPVLGGGDDTITASIANSLNAGDVINGKAGKDTLNITAEQDVTFGATTLTNVETVKISHTTGTVKIVTDDATVATGQILTVDGSKATGAIDWNGFAETDGKFSVTGGSGADTIRTGEKADTLTGGAGNDTFIGSVSRLGGDTITDFAVGDMITVTVSDLTALDGKAASGTIDLGLGQTLTLTGITAASGTFSVVREFGHSYITLVAPVIPPTTPPVTPPVTPPIVVTPTTPTTPGSGEDTQAETITNNGTTPGSAPIVQNSNNNGNVVTATLPGGTSLTSEGPSQAQNPTDALGSLVSSIEARGSTSQTELVGGAQSFLTNLAETTTLDVRTIVPTSTSTTAPGTPIIISGTTDAGQSEAFVIDMRSMPSGSSLQLDNIEFASILGSVTVTGGAGQNYVVGDDANQYIMLGADDDYIDGGAGDDTVGSAGGNDTLLGGAGNDSVFGGEGNDSLDGGDGFDILDLTGGGSNVAQGGKQGDTVLGGDGGDELRGGKGHDSITGGAGDDVIYSGQGNDTLTGGDGADLFVLKGFDANFASAILTPTITDFEQGTDRFAVENTSLAELEAALAMQSVTDTGVVVDVAGASLTFLGISALTMADIDMGFYA